MARVRAGILEPLDQFGRLEGFREIVVRDHLSAGNQRRDGGRDQHEPRRKNGAEQDDQCGADHDQRVRVRLPSRDLDANVAAAHAGFEHPSLDTIVRDADYAWHPRVVGFGRIELQDDLGGLGVRIAVKLVDMDVELHHVERGRMLDDFRDAPPAIDVVGEPPDRVALCHARRRTGAERGPPTLRLRPRDLDGFERQLFLRRKVAAQHFFERMLAEQDAPAAFVRIGKPFGVAIVKTPDRGQAGFDGTQRAEQLGR